MVQANPSLLRRVALACGSFFAIIANPELAGAVARLRAGAIPPETDEPKPAAPTLREAPHEAALQLLGLLQRDARLVDFLEEDIAPHGDADIGAAARIVHEGCRRVLREHSASSRCAPKTKAAASPSMQASMLRRSASPATSSASRHSPEASAIAVGGWSTPVCPSSSPAMIRRSSRRRRSSYEQPALHHRH